MTDPQPVGADLARIALQQARAAAKGRPTAPGKPVRRRTVRRTDGRDPLPLGAAMQQLMAEHGWEEPAAGGTVIEDWAVIAPELAGKVAAERYDAETGSLFLRPVNSAYGAQLRLLHLQVTNQINAKMGRTVVRSLRVLPPGQVPAVPSGAAAAVPADSQDGHADRTPGPAAPGTAPVAAPGAPGGPPLKTRADASPGLLAAIEVLTACSGRVPRTPKPVSALADAPVLRETPGAFTDGAVLTEDLAAAAARSEDVRARARARTRLEKAGQAPAVPRVFEQSA